MRASMGPWVLGAVAMLLAGCGEGDAATGSSDPSGVTPSPAASAPATPAAPGAAACGPVAPMAVEIPGAGAPLSERFLAIGERPQGPCFGPWREFGSFRDPSGPDGSGPYAVWCQLLEDGEAFERRHWSSNGFRRQDDGLTPRLDQADVDQYLAEFADPAAAVAAATALETKVRACLQSPTESRSAAEVEQLPSVESPGGAIVLASTFQPETATEPLRLLYAIGTRGTRITVLGLLTADAAGRAPGVAFAETARAALQRL